MPVLLNILHTVWMRMEHLPGATIFFLQFMIFFMPLLALTFWGAYPSRRLFLSVFGLLFLSLLVSLHSVLGVWITVTADICLLAIIFVDFLTLPSAQGFVVKRKISPVASLRKYHPVEITVENHTRRKCRVLVRDDADQDLLPVNDKGNVHYEKCQQEMEIPGGTLSAWTYFLRPRVRGLFEFYCVYFRFSSFFGFWVRQQSLVCNSTLRVYPDMRQLAEYDLLARTNRLHLMGVRKTRRIGQDNDFERLRDYTIDDDHRHIDWRATARRKKLIVKDFQTTQNQNVVFLLDCGRTMTHSETILAPEEFSEAKWKATPGAVNSMLMLAWVALKQGDSVGLLCFSDKIHSFTPPRSGMRHLNGLLHASFDRFPEPVGSRYDLAFQYLASHVRKRTLVILLTNFFDEASTLFVSRNLRNLHGKHLPMLALLRDHQLFDPLDNLLVHNPELREKSEVSLSLREGYPSWESILEHYEQQQNLHIPPGENAADFVYSAAAAADLIWRRQEQLAKLRASGVILVDAYPEDLTGALISRYLEIKARHLL
ncbi:MAG: DUF58 domain-containing protein [Planctomycetia bacterium]|nr:DUF58 domain-containing protein [Planctomycetia bacterium]